jgi:hypothetical protein
MSQRKTGNTAKDNPNQDIADFLMELSSYEQNVSRNVYKANAYKKAAGVIANQPNRIRSGDEVSFAPIFSTLGCDSMSWKTGFGFAGKGHNS